MQVIMVSSLMFFIANIFFTQALSIKLLIIVIISDLLVLGYKLTIGV